MYRRILNNNKVYNKLTYSSKNNKLYILYKKNKIKKNYSEPFIIKNIYYLKKILTK